MFTKIKPANRIPKKVTRHSYKFLSTEAISLKVGKSESVEWTRARPFRELPGPTRFGLVRGFMPGGTYYKKSFNDYIQKAREQYGDVYRIPGIFGKEDIILSFNLEDFRNIFRTEGIWPARPATQSMAYYRKKYRGELYDKSMGLINSQGEQWAKFRTAVNPVLMQPRNTVTYVTPMQEVNDEFLKRIRKVRDPVTHEVPGNFVEDINRLTFESVAVVALNTHLGLLNENRDNPATKELFTSLMTFINLMYNLDFQPSVWKYVWTPTFAKYRKCLDVIYDTTIGYVNEAIERLENKKHDDTSQLSVLEKLIKIDKTVAIVMAADMLMAGVDTTSTTMTGILLQIAKNPEKQAKLREEVRRFLPEKDSVFTEETMKNLPYLRACIKEGIRLYPIGPGNARYVGEDLVICGFQIPKGSQVLLNSNLLLRDARYFSKPNDYIPERWIRKEATEIIAPFSYTPFGFGPRMCIGKRIVDLELEVTLARLVRNFYMEFNYSIENAFESYFINKPAIPLKFKFTETEN